jgi:hypothetical protein
VIVTTTATAFGDNFEPAEHPAQMVRIELANYRSIQVPLDLFLGIVDKSPSLRQLGIELEACLDGYEVANLRPRVAAAGA